MTGMGDDRATVCTTWVGTDRVNAVWSVDYVIGYVSTSADDVVENVTAAYFGVNCVSLWDVAEMVSVGTGFVDMSST